MNSNPSGATHPTLLMVIWAISSLGLQVLWPLKLPESLFFTTFGITAIILGCLLLVWADIALRRGGATGAHSMPTKSLVINGPFRFSRNPIYLSLILLFAGLALKYNNLWCLILIVPFTSVLHYRTILPEEKYLEQEFGATYSDYRASVRRWL